MMPSGVNIELEGMQRLERLLATGGRRVDDYMGQALYEEASEVMLLSQELVPVRDGYLKGSGTVSHPERRDGGISVELYYGGPAAPYALYVHERPARHAPPTRSKFLDLPMRRQAAGLGNRLLARIEAMFRQAL